MKPGILPSKLLFIFLKQRLRRYVQFILFLFFIDDFE